MWKSQSPKACLNCQSTLLKRHAPMDQPKPKEGWAFLTFTIHEKTVLRTDLWECKACGYVHFMAQRETPTTS